MSRMLALSPLNCTECNEMQVIENNKSQKSSARVERGPKPGPILYIVAAG